MKPNRDVAFEFLEALDAGSQYTFKTCDDSGECRPLLQKVFHGTLEASASMLRLMNAAGASVSVVVNQLDAIVGPAKEPMEGLPGGNRTYLYKADDVGSCVGFVVATFDPDIVVEVGPGRFRACWRVKNVPAEVARLRWSLRQTVACFPGDEQQDHQPHTMRVPGFLNWRGEPFVTGLAYTRGNSPYDDAGESATDGEHQVDANTPPPEGSKQ